MLDGVYQSAIAFFLVYEIFYPATFATSSGLDLAEYRRMGVYAATSAVCAANIYVLYNTYRWDWLMLTIVVLSTICVWFWTGVFTSFTSSAQFYKAGAEVYGNLNFWAYVLVATIICLLPRFVFKSVQKMYFPLDVDIIREQVKQGKFDYLKDNTSYLPPPPGKDAPPQPEADADKYKHANADPADEDVRPIYPPSVAPTATTHNPRSQNGSNSTDYTYRRSMEGLPPAPRMSYEGRANEGRVRPSFDRARMSMDRVRPSFEQSNDFTSAAMLGRIESAHSRHSYVGRGQTNAQNNITTGSQAMTRLRNAIRRATLTRDDAPTDLHDAPAVPAMPSVTSPEGLTQSPPGSPPRSPPRR
jgi:phospholipid-translocating ATPase